MRKFVLLPIFGLGLLAGPAMAGYAPAGYVSNINIDPDGVVTFDLSTMHLGAPSCQSTTTPNRWSFSSTGDVGQARLSILLTSYSLHEPVSVGGSSLCADRPDAEGAYSMTAVGG